MEALTLENLNTGSSKGTRLAVLGDPVNHSLSPVMHTAALDEMAGMWPELADWSYEAVQVPASRLETALAVLHREGFAGINLTIPHKVEVLPFLEEVDPMARKMGAVNTLVRSASGYRGTNTDGFGIVRAVEESFSRSPQAADVWIFGAGGAARGTLFAFLEAGARRVTVINRSPNRLQELETDLRQGSWPGLERVRFFQSGEAPVDPDDGAILINATALGLKEADKSPVPPEFLTGGAAVYDTTYGVVNRLCGSCREAGIPYADGLAMLVWQGARSLEIWTGHPVPAETMKREVLEELKRRNQNG